MGQLGITNVQSSPFFFLSPSADPELLAAVFKGWVQTWLLAHMEVSAIWCASWLALEEKGRTSRRGKLKEEFHREIAVSYNTPMICSWMSFHRMLRAWKPKQEQTSLQFACIAVIHHLCIHTHQHRQRTIPISKRLLSSTKKRPRHKFLKLCKFISGHSGRQKWVWKEKRKQHWQVYELLLNVVVLGKSWLRSSQAWGWSAGFYSVLHLWLPAFNTGSDGSFFFLYTILTSSSKENWGKDEKFKTISSQRWTQWSVKSSTWGGTTPGIRTRQGPPSKKAAWQKRGSGSWWTSSWTWASNVP